MASCVCAANNHPTRARKNYFSREFQSGTARSSPNASVRVRIDARTPNERRHPRFGRVLHHSLNSALPAVAHIGRISPVLPSEDSAPAIGLGIRQRLPPCAVRSLPRQFAGRGRNASSIRSLSSNRRVRDRRGGTGCATPWRGPQDWHFGPSAIDPGGRVLGLAAPNRRSWSIDLMEHALLALGRATLAHRTLLGGSDLSRALPVDPKLLTTRM